MTILGLSSLTKIRFASACYKNIYKSRVNVLRQFLSIKTSIIVNFFFILNKNTLRLRLLQKYLKIRVILCMLYPRYARIIDTSLICRY